MTNYDLIIIGAGPAGLSAALYAARAGVKTLILDKGTAGGQISSTAVIENYPGYESLSGPRLIELMVNHAKKFGVELKELVEVVSINIQSKNRIKIETKSAEFEAKAIIIATGRREKKLGVKGEEELKGRGVSYCAVCDAPFFRSKDVVVVGGGNSALEEANYLTKFANSVTIIHRRDKFRAEKAVQQKVEGNQKIKFMLDSVVEEIVGTNAVEKLKIKNLKTGEVSEIKADGIFIYVGMIPNTEVFKGKIALDEYGQIIVDDEKRTNVEGVFAAGDVTNSKVKQVVTAVADGAIAAVFAEKYLSGE